MSIQVIHDKNGNPEYAVVPYELYQRLIANADDNALYESVPYVSDDDDDVTIPHEVVSIHIDQDVSIQAAWRILRGLSQQEVAKALGITQAAVSQLESPDSRPQKRTRNKLAELYNCKPEQLIL
ncbi:helix-turn-helix transcriptional regulator [Brenneria goodwinii]|uniref:helix-turn-helix domain-containing protein n=1 Tax=Brenneria goodwinii TaxID=1109412 RepID=UPI00065E0DC8|nr:helix-turn-helix transcriptional regulator [Brenneria goodwinii]MCG8155194.1 helix-turn-helix transcriptional regulator [Brenneria goodwinii]MCG8159438.1 helix-turn-helix transcriptional regulator [Brenneria goodwinii]MCG8164393.1 helix-turn-helix transcriptional regulator [Brenneria goodwinii]MCG8169041.1 helix-turn-helix transcriptional regulator [Brenneria goodwinii]MCG8173297.1 helix-turn-helix transcriptional regulator [Brenneria goodwinii]